MAEGGGAIADDPIEGGTTAAGGAIALALADADAAAAAAA